MHYLSRSKFVRCSYFLEVAERQLEPWYIEAFAYVEYITHWIPNIYSIFLNLQCFVGTRKNRLNETLVFVYSNAYFCKTRAQCKIRGEE